MSTLANTTATSGEIPRGNLSGFTKYFKYDFVSGFLVFLIALPLCLGIALASGYPVLAGVFTAIIGALVTTFISNSELTIKGPAAGMIVIVLGCIEAFGGDGFGNGITAADQHAYECALAVGVVAAVLQIFFGIFRAGILGEFFPISAVHGMLAAIGVIIISKQIPVALGVTAKGDPLELLMGIPKFIMQANPAIALIGIISLLIMFLWPLIKAKSKLLNPIPAALVVLAIAVPMGMGFDLLHKHSYTLQNHEYQLGDQYLVQMPDHAFGMFENIPSPDFTALQQGVAWKWVFMFFMIGSLESLLSAKAVDLIDPWRRKSNMNRDIAAVGVANLCASWVGGLPMISEIVRSKANIDNGARTRFADLWHGVFLLVCVALFPFILHRIPVAALAAMLIYTGTRLAHPKEFMHALHIGREQLVIFAATLIGVLATDLLVGIGIGIGLKLLIHLYNGLPLKSVFKPYLDVNQIDDNTCQISAKQSAVFTNWIPFRREIEHMGLVNRKNLIIDLSEAKLVDHSVMDKLTEMKRDFEQEGLSLEIRGLDAHSQFSTHELAARRRAPGFVNRLTVVCDPSIEAVIVENLIRIGITGYTTIACKGAGRSDLQSGQHPNAKVQLEVIATRDLCDQCLNYLRQEVAPHYRVTVTVETVEVFRSSHFEPQSKNLSAQDHSATNTPAFKR